MKTLLLALLLALPALGQSQQDWTTANTVMESAFVVATAMDWASTLNIERYNREHHLPHKEFHYADSGQYLGTTTIDPTEESNRIMGKRPTRATVNQYFATVLLAHAAISISLPRKSRLPFQTLTLLISVEAVSNNKKLGLRFTF